MLVRESYTENGLGLGGHVLRQVEARKIEPRMPAFRHRRRSGKPDQSGLSRVERRIAVVTPQLSVERVGPKTVASGCWPSAVADNDSPSGRLMLILSAPSSAVISSARGCTTTP